MATRDEATEPVMAEQVALVGVTKDFDGVAAVRDLTLVVAACAVPALAQHQRPFLKLQAVARRKLGQKRPLVECDRLGPPPRALGAAQRVAVRVALALLEQRAERGHVERAAGGRVALDALARHQQQRRGRVALAQRAAQVRQRLV